jgi:hypothetical protein
MSGVCCLHLDASVDGGSDKEWVKMTCHVFRHLSGVKITVRVV